VVELPPQILCGSLISPVKSLVHGHGRAIEFDCAVRAAPDRDRLGGVNDFWVTAHQDSPERGDLLR